MAGLGWGGPAALGAQAALGPQSRVFALVGDGAWAYSLADIETSVRFDLPVVFVILNNGSLAWVRHGQERGGKVLSADFSPADYAGAAESFGATGIRVGPDDELEAALAAALRADGPALVDVRSSRVLSPVLSPLPDAAADGGTRDAYRQ
jgi:acetolactate synthase-1/2/3 large subunit